MTIEGSQICPFYFLFLKLVIANLQMSIHVYTSIIIMISQSFCPSEKGTPTQKTTKIDISRIIPNKSVNKVKREKACFHKMCLKSFILSKGPSTLIP